MSESRSPSPASSPSLVEAGGVIRIARAHPSDADTLTRIAIAAKGHWGYPASWMERWRPVLTVAPASIAAHETYAAYSATEIVGFSALRVDGDLLHLKDLFVLPGAMGCGVGSALFRHALHRAGVLGYPAIEIQSDPNAAGFYERMGAEHVGTNFSLLEDRRRELPLFRCHVGHRGNKT